MSVKQAVRQIAPGALRVSPGQGAGLGISSMDARQRSHLRIAEGAAHLASKLHKVLDGGRVGVGRR